MTKNFQQYNPFGPDPRLIGKKGYVYIIKNDKFSKKLLKIGATTRTCEDRVKEFNIKSNEATPGKYYCVFHCKTCDCGRAELDVHQELDKYRVDKEWFKVPKEIAEDSISKHCSKYDRKAEEEKRVREKEEKQIKKAAQRRKKEKAEREAKRRAKNRAKKERERVRKRAERDKERVEREEAAEKRQQLILRGIILGVGLFALWYFWPQIVWTITSLFYVSLTAVAVALLCIALTYLKRKIFSDYINDIDIEAPEDRPPTSI